ncbi:MAG: DNA polymerase III subunit beta [Verrucomicrobia bacterium]|nr:DNA polymerase III subunit beta [Verrucomicrobiota bacterium]
MKFLISKLELQALISKIQTIVPARPALPVLSNVLLEATGDQIILSSTDLTVSMRAHAPAKITEEGSIALPAKRFFQLIRELTTSEVEIETSSAEVAHIYAGSSHFKMSGLAKSEFPTFPDLSGGLKMKLHNTVLREMLARSSFAAARDDNRQVLNGILLQNLDKAAIFVGTDGKRLARLSTNTDAASNPSSSILPLKAVEEIIKLIDTKEEFSTLTLMADKIAFETSSILLISKLLTGQYPDVGQVIPKKSENPIILHREELMSLLRQVALFTSEESSAVRFSFSPGQLHLTAMSGSVGEGKVAMAVNYGGPKMEVAFNPHYFHDILRHSKDETVNLTLTDPYNPGLITDSTTAEFVIMPMRVDA